MSLRSWKTRLNLNLSAWAVSLLSVLCCWDSRLDADSAGERHNTSRQGLGGGGGSGSSSSCSNSVIIMSRNKS